MPNSEVYRHPAYYHLGYRWNTEVECDFIEACLRAHGRPKAARPLDSAAAGAAALARGRPERAERVEGRLLDIGCGSGRHLLELARRGHRMTGIDASPEMVAFVQGEAARERLAVEASVDDLRALRLDGTFDAAYCFMDTFRFLLTTESILRHLRAVAARLSPGGLYLTDFWIPRAWGEVGQEVHQWEQTEGPTTVRVFYVQYPESIDPLAQTFEDELVFEVQDNGQTTTIRGGPTRTRLIMPREFEALVAACGAFALRSTHGSFDLTAPLEPATLSWRMISVLQKL
jgi:SAM-dependent methyltransferase